MSEAERLKTGPEVRRRVKRRERLTLLAKTTGFITGEEPHFRCRKAEERIRTRRHGHVVNKADHWRDSLTITEVSQKQSINWNKRTENH